MKRSLPLPGTVPVLLTLLGFAVFPPPSQAAEGALEVYYPPGQTVVDEDLITVEGSTTDPELDGVEIVVNGESSYRAYVRDFVFSEEVYLDPGVNTITVGDVSRKVFLAAAGEEAPSAYRRVYGHFGLSDGCLECHVVDDAGAFTFDDEPGEVCEWCHGDLTGGTRGEDLASVHGPLEEGKCLICHTPHLASTRNLPVAKPPECRECHEGVFERLDKDRYVHGPLNLGDCRLCHEIHSSAQPSLLVESPTTLCTQCHSEVETRPDTPEELRPHPMIPEGLCGQCHFPHSSEHPRMMREPSSRICYGCHAEKTKSFHEKKGFSIYVCQKCHDLHRPKSAHLIVDNSRFLCLECHEFSGDAAFTHEFIKEGGCFTCHSFHAAPLSEDIATICLRCHGDNPRLGEVHGGVPVDTSRCTLCHRPHQSDREKLFFRNEHTPFAERDCAACHEERAQLLGGERKGLCLDCHGEKGAEEAVAAGKEVHPPVEEEDCSFCHLDHASAEPAQLREREIDLCLRCHREFKKATVITPKSFHRFVIDGECHRCHDPHSSADSPLLRKPLADLCVPCHGGITGGPAGEGWAVEHEPVAKRKCRLCHVPHTSRRESLLKKPMPQPCRPCHSKLFSSMDRAGANKSHEPVREGECKVCHQVHGSAGAALVDPVKERDLCVSCHPRPKGGHHLFTEGELVSKTSREERNLCLFCHRPHSSTERRLLRSMASPVCQGCHGI